MLILIVPSADFEDAENEMATLREEQKSLVRLLQSSGVVPESVGCAPNSAPRRRCVSHKRPCPDSWEHLSRMLSLSECKLRDIPCSACCGPVCRQEMLRAMVDLKDDSSSAGGGANRTKSRQQPAGGMQSVAEGEDA